MILKSAARLRRSFDFAEVFDGAENAVYAHTSSDVLGPGFVEIWKRRIPKREAMGIHGILYYGGDQKKPYYPTRRDEEAINPDGKRLR